MAETALTEEEEKEFFDSDEELDKKVTKLAELIKQSEYFTMFTGAGISTSTGVADYRSGMKTVLNTGPGKWVKEAAKQKGIQFEEKKQVDIMCAYPSVTHLAINKLQELGYLQFLVSQNVDGLHVRSGFPIEQIAELHGNLNIEFCKNQKCKTKYWRSYKTRHTNATARKSHLTGRKCVVCKEPLFDCIIAFEENLDFEVLDTAIASGSLSDLCIAMGSSLSVYPACSIPAMVNSEEKKKKGHLVIINLQKTKYDSKCSIRIFAKCDVAMSLLMQKLKFPVDKLKFIYNKYLYIKIDLMGNNKEQKSINDDNDDDLDDDLLRKVTIHTIDEDGMRCSILKKIMVSNNAKQKVIIKGNDVIEKDIFEFNINYWDSGKDQVFLTLIFIANYHEPPLTIPMHEYIMYAQPDTHLLRMSFDAEQKKWDVTKTNSDKVKKMKKLKIISLNRCSL